MYDQTVVEKQQQLVLDSKQVYIHNNALTRTWSQQEVAEQANNLYTHRQEACQQLGGHTCMHRRQKKTHLHPNCQHLDAVVSEQLRATHC